METFSAFLAIPAQRPVTRSFDVFFHLRLNKRLSKHLQGWWFETLSRPLWRHRNVVWAPNLLSHRWWSEVGIMCWQRRLLGDGRIAHKQSLTVWSYSDVTWSPRRLKMLVTELHLEAYSVEITMLNITDSSWSGVKLIGDLVTDRHKNPWLHRRCYDGGSPRRLYFIHYGTSWLKCLTSQMMDP